VYTDGDAADDAASMVEGVKTAASATITDATFDITVLRLRRKCATLLALTGSSSLRGHKIKNEGCFAIDINMRKLTIYLVNPARHPLYCKSSYRRGWVEVDCTSRPHARGLCGKHGGDARSVLDIQLVPPTQNRTVSVSSMEHKLGNQPIENWTKVVPSSTPKNCCCRLQIRFADGSPASLYQQWM
jgi:hypothetical protein